MNLNESIQSLADARRIVQEYRDEIASLEAELAETPAGKRLAQVRDLLAVAREDEAGADDRVRFLALEAYNGNGDKRPHPAVTVKMYTVLAYEPDKALAYCLYYLPQALKMDKGAFEKVAKVVDLDFVTVSKEPRATIARKL